MNATRARIDRKLDLLQARVTEASDRTVRVAGQAAAVLAATAVVWSIWRLSRRRSRRRAPVGWA
ncbi:MAG: hypothetical protein ABI051_00845 [Vicinamibacterales bacterium]